MGIPKKRGMAPYIIIPEGKCCSLCVDKKNIRRYATSPPLARTDAAVNACKFDNFSRVLRIRREQWQTDSG